MVSIFSAPAAERTVHKISSRKNNARFMFFS
jgi:hypothetical protein